MSPVSKDPVARLAERQNWSTPRAEIAAQRTIADTLDAIGGTTLRKALHGTWLHEPIHAVLVTVPLGAWTGTVAFDAIAALSGKSEMDTAADATLLLGLAGAVGAAVTGMNDWAEVKHAAPRRIGAMHALLNVASTGFFVASLIARRRRSSRPTGRALSALGYLIGSVSAHLGGNMVYEHGVGVSERTKTDELLGV